MALQNSPIIAPKNQFMLLVKTTVKPSKIHGLGLFALQFIPKGCEIWKFTSGFDQKFSREQILKFPKLLQIYLCKYAWRSQKSKLYILAVDDAKYFNHSEEPNCLSEYRTNEEEVVTVGIRDIQIGEEITDNYSSFADKINGEDVLKYIENKYGLSDEVDPRLKNLN